MKLLMIDNYDSFTYNLVQYFSQLGAEVVTVRNDVLSVKELMSEGLSSYPDKVVISPGPGKPDSAGVSVELIKFISKLSNPLPVLGVCLGHQSIGVAFGAKVIRAKSIMHGKVSSVIHEGKGLFSGLPSPYNVTRYHSLAIENKTLPVCFEISAWSEDEEIMAITHRTLPFFGVQYHPEAIMTEHGFQLLRNFLEV
ncbi:MAG: anthranilate/aminodeoxychorismate synthase component II [Betaproteobacteria bacterium TMED156]|nr:MAG: anthranilate/aminodeoxychorismate synthase component II [Betaproteobacteria bacterium TMED156]